MGTTRVKVVDLSNEQEEEKKTPKKKARLASEATRAEEKVTQVAEVSEVTKVSEEEEEKIEGQDQAVQGQTLPEQPQGPTLQDKVKAKSATKPKKQKHHLGKKYKEAAAKVDPKQSYKVDEALSLVKATSYVKFDPTVEVHLNVVDKSVRGKVSFPHSVGTKKEKKYLVFADKQSLRSSSLDKLGTAGLKHTDAKNVVWADEKSIPDLESGKLKPSRDFDAVITSPKYMPHLAKVAKILGPKGMMPNPKNGTITDDIEKILAGSTDDTTVEFKTDPTAAIVHTKIGKLSFGEKSLGENLKALTTSIGPSKIKKVTISVTMGPGIKIDITTLGK